MIISVETPVFKGAALERCINSVLYQSSPDWTFSLLWDGGDEQSRRILEQLEREKHPNVTIYFHENRGIARARRFLSEHSRGDFILPLDDDDALPFHAVERFLNAARERPWAAVIRGHRKIIDLDGTVLRTPPWFPFEPRHYRHGMVTDLPNHTQPYLISRAAYDRTTGWEGFQDFGFAGEDCDIYLKLEEVGTIELLDEMLYYYRIHPNRASLVLTDEGAYEMWRRLADKTIERIGLPLKRVSDRPPYEYERMPRPIPTLAAVEFVIRSSEGTSSLSTDVTAGLKRAGIADSAIRVVSDRGLAALNDALRRTTLPLICLLDADIHIDGREQVDTLLRSLHEGDADLVGPRIVDEGGMIVWSEPRFGADHRPTDGSAGPRDGGENVVERAPWLSEKLMLVRREVVKAVGGVDEGYSGGRTGIADFCLRARQRDFRCVYVAAPTFRCRGVSAPQDSEPDLDRLRRKWAVYPELFADS